MSSSLSFYRYLADHYIGYTDVPHRVRVKLSVQAGLAYEQARSQSSLCRLLQSWERLIYPVANETRDHPDYLREHVHPADRFRTAAVNAAAQIAVKACNDMARLIETAAVPHAKRMQQLVAAWRLKQAHKKQRAEQRLARAQEWQEQHAQR